MHKVDPKHLHRPSIQIDPVGDIRHPVQCVEQAEAVARQEKDKIAAEEIERQQQIGVCDKTNRKQACQRQQRKAGTEDNVLSK